MNVEHFHQTLDGPDGLPIQLRPALYKVFDQTGQYGNYDLANRPADMKINYIVIHNTETSYEEAIRLFSTPTATSANYIVRSSDGAVFEMVRPQNVAWHAGNWYINAHSIGIEHEGYAKNGRTWFTENMYQASARLVKYLATKYDIPLDRQHIIGHDNVPGSTPAAQEGMHWDPGTYWDWEHYFELLGMNLKQNIGDGSSRVITITPDPKFNLLPKFGEKVTDNGTALSITGSNFVYLYKGPTFSSGLISGKSGTNGTFEADDWHDKGAYGQQFCKLGENGDWTEIDYGGQNAWFYNPGRANSTDSQGRLVKSDGSNDIPIYGSAYPDNQILKENHVTGVTPTPIYQIKPGRKYVYGETVRGDCFNSRFDSVKDGNVIHGSENYYQIQFNHRIAFIKTSDAELN